MGPRRTIQLSARRVLVTDREIRFQMKKKLSKRASTKTAQAVICTRCSHRAIHAQHTLTNCRRSKTLASKGLKELDCTSNNLTPLSELPKGLEVLSCSLNNLISLPELPKGLKTLNCFYNNLTSLPELPKGLKTLNIILCEQPSIFTRITKRVARIILW